MDKDKAAPEKQPDAKSVLNFVKGVESDYDQVFWQLRRRKISAGAADARRRSLDLEMSVLWDVVFGLIYELFVRHEELKDLIAERRSEERAFFFQPSLQNGERERQQ